MISHQILITNLLTCGFNNFVLFPYAGLESLPVELQRNFKLMRDLDGRAQTVMQEIDRLGMEFLEIAGEATQEEKKEHVARIHVSNSMINH